MEGVPEVKEEGGGGVWRAQGPTALATTSNSRQQGSNNTGNRQAQRRARTQDGRCKGPHCPKTWAVGSPTSDHQTHRGVGQDLAQEQEVPYRQKTPSNLSHYTCPPSRHQLSPNRRQLTPNQRQLTPTRHQLTPNRRQLTPNLRQLTPNRRQLTREGKSPKERPVVEI